MKLRDITKKIPKGKVNLLTGKPVKIAKSKYKKVKSEKTGSYISNYEPASLNLEISDKYEGAVNGVSGLIRRLPNELKTFINNANLVATNARQGFTIYKLDNGCSVKITETTIGKHHKLHIVIKKGKKELINNYI